MGVLKNKLVDKKIKKIVDGFCKICGESNRSVLDVHRIIPGENGGKYTESNTVTLCSNCHRKSHSGEIKILKKFPSSGGFVLVYIDSDGKEVTKQA